jgi:hypothetical protein
MLIIKVGADSALAPTPIKMKLLLAALATKLFFLSKKWHSTSYTSY